MKLNTVMVTPRYNRDGRIAHYVLRAVYQRSGVNVAQVLELVEPDERSAADTLQDMLTGRIWVVLSAQDQSLLQPEGEDDASGEA